MRGQLAAGKGSGNPWGILGVSDSFFRSSWPPERILLYAGLAMIVGFMPGLLAIKTVFKAKRPS